MLERRSPSLLAIGIDALEFSAVDRLMRAGRLPSLSALAGAGVRGQVDAHAWLGSGAVWPTFAAGEGPPTHGFYSDLAWVPEQMRLERASFGHISPFWRRWADESLASTVIDVPFVMPENKEGCVEVLDWGPHDWLGGRTSASTSTASSAVQSAGAHPFSRHVPVVGSREDERGRRRIVRDCIAGIEKRGDLAFNLFRSASAPFHLVVFSEAHRAGHYVWEDGGGGESGPLDEIIVHVDREVGRLVRQAGPSAHVMVFSLHGMRAASGVPHVLDPLLMAWGLASRGPEKHQPPSGRGSVGAVARQWLRSRARRWYHLSASRATVMRHARPESDLAPWDWSRTAAFSLPTDQHGWLRVNLQGREAGGIVPVDQYDEVCTRLEKQLMAVHTVHGRALVLDVVRCAASGREPRDLRLPDLVVHWSDAALEVPVRLATPPIACWPRAKALRGQHAPLGGYIFRPGSQGFTGDVPSRFAAENLGCWFRSWLLP